MSCCGSVPPLRPPIDFAQQSETLRVRVNNLRLLEGPYKDNGINCAVLVGSFHTIVPL